jgi:hypothetical protein
MAHHYILDTKNIYTELKTTADVTHTLNNIHKHGKIEQIKREKRFVYEYKGKFLHLHV